MPTILIFVVSAVLLNFFILKFFKNYIVASSLICLFVFANLGYFLSVDNQSKAIFTFIAGLFGFALGFSVLLFVKNTLEASFKTMSQPQTDGKGL